MQSSWGEGHSRWGTPTRTSATTIPSADFRADPSPAERYTETRRAPDLHTPVSRTKPPGYGHNLLGTLALSPIGERRLGGQWKISSACRGCRWAESRLYFFSEFTSAQPGGYSERQARQILPTSNLAECRIVNSNRTQMRGSCERRLQSNCPAEPGS